MFWYLPIAISCLSNLATSAGCLQINKLSPAKHILRGGYLGGILSRKIVYVQQITVCEISGYLFLGMKAVLPFLNYLYAQLLMLLVFCLALSFYKLEKSLAQNVLFYLFKKLTYHFTNFNEYNNNLVMPVIHIKVALYNRHCLPAELE